MNRFQRDTAVRALGDGRYAARIDAGWFVIRGPNGGYVAAILLRALAETVGEPARMPRSLTIHFTSPPAEGEIEIRTVLERAGRSVSTATARLEQGGKLRALAIASFGSARPGPLFSQVPFPEVPPPERALPFPPSPRPIPIRDRYESRLAFGSPFAPSAEAATGGWLRLREDPGPVDAPLLAAYTDAWPPAIFTQVDPGAVLGGVPTLDLTVHFRAPWPGHLDPQDFVLVAFRSRLARDGFVEEDGEIWTRDGLLLAQSRQLAVMA